MTPYLACKKKQKNLWKSIVDHRQVFADYVPPPVQFVFASVKGNEKSHQQYYQSYTFEYMNQRSAGVRETVVSTPEGEPQSSKLVRDGSEHKPIPRQPNRYKFARIEIILAVIMSFGQFGYHLLMIGIKSYKIQQERPMDGVVKSWFGFYRDDSDSQWREFRENMPIFIFGLSVFVILSGLIKKHFVNSKEKFETLMIFYLVSGVSYLLFLFQGGFVIWFTYTFGNYCIQKILYRSRYYPIILWILSIWQLYYNYYHKDQPFEILSQYFPALGGYLLRSDKDSMVAWNLIYNMTQLRVMSFGLDRNWMHRRQYSFDREGHLKKCDNCKENKICYKAHSEQALEPQYYNNVIYYYAYLTYIPLFITGPQVTFNAFVSQVRTNQTTLSNQQVQKYLIHALKNILILEIYTHLHFASALCREDDNRQYWLHFGLVESLFMGISNLIFVWLKFLTIWRLARAFSILDGIDVPENMNRCIFNTYCFEGFWRSWHRGFNQWLIRYLFIPIGGNKTKLWNVWVIFTFVAIWHDFTIDLVAWAWMICLAMIPEIIAKKWAHNQRGLWKTYWFKYFCAFFACLQLWMMAFSNLIGFGNGWYNMEIILAKAFEPGAGIQLLIAFSAMYWIPICGYYTRDQEHETSKGYVSQGF